MTGKSSGSNRPRSADDATAPAAAGSKRQLQATDTGGDAHARHKRGAATGQVRSSRRMRTAVTCTSCY
jgi:hypothetical protein